MQAKDLSVNQGSSLLSMFKLSKKKGYELVAVTDCNAIFVKKEYFKLFGIKNNSPERLKFETKSFGTRLFQLYDGTLVLTGCDRLIWKNKKINREDIQALPTEERFFGDRVIKK